MNIHYFTHFPGADGLALEKAQPLPAEVYEHLPALLNKACSFYKKPHEKDVLLLGLIPVLGACMPNVWAPHNVGRYAPMPYTAVIAPPASGKGGLRWASKVAQRVDKHLEKESRIKRAKWEKKEQRLEARQRELEKQRTNGDPQANRGIR